MKPPDSPVIRIGAWRVDPALDEISRDNETVKLEPQAMRLLVCLAGHAGAVVSVEQLLDQVWKGVIVTPNSVYRAVATLRRTLGDDAKNPTYIANTLRRGYRLMARVDPWADAQEQSGESPAAAAEAGSLPDTKSVSVPMIDGTIAVMPFVDMSEKHDQQYFADGMAEEVANLLTKVPGVRVIGRTACSQFRGKSEDLRKIGSVLGAAYAVEGSVRRSGNRLRVTAQLIGTQDGSHLWSGSYDKDFDEVLKIQDEIAAGLVRALQVAVGADLPSRPILKSAVGYDLYQRGRHALDRFDKVGFESAAGYFEQALALDPTALRAAESLALVHIYIAEWGYAPPREGFQRARASCASVLKLDPNSAMAHAQLAFISAVYDWDWAAAVAGIQGRLLSIPATPGYSSSPASSIWLWVDWTTRRPPLTPPLRSIRWVRSRTGSLVPFTIEAAGSAKRRWNFAEFSKSARRFFGRTGLLEPSCWRQGSWTQHCRTCIRRVRNAAAMRVSPAFTTSWGTMPSRMRRSRGPRRTLPELRHTV